MIHSDHNERVQRREFLSQLGVIAAVSGLAATASAGSDKTPDAAVSLPSIQLGQHQLSRMVAGWNPIGGHSYLGPHMDRHMKEYFTVEQTVQFLLDCEKVGINAHQFSAANTTPEVMRKAREAGSRMKFFGLHAGREGVFEFARDTQPFALVHHGGVTDRLFRENKAQEVHDYVKEVHDRGLLAGVSAHNPDCIRRIADEDWEVDFFMCCFYYLTRQHASPSSKGEMKLDTLQIAYPFYRDDPATMTHVIRQVRQPCFGFKILGAGRLCANQAMVRGAFQFAYENIKPTDGVIVGMYPRFFDEVGADAKYTRELGTVL
jgi:hypothetical protein